MSRILRSAITLSRSPHFVRGRSVDEPVASLPTGSAQTGRRAEHTTDAPAADEEPVLSEELRALLASLESSILDAEQMRRNSLEELQQLAVELAVAIAGQLVFRAIEADHFDANGLVMAAIDQLGLDTPVTISLHPADIQLLDSQPSEGEPIWRTGSVTLRPDPSFPRGHCRATNGTTVLLSELAPRLTEIRELLWEGLHDAQIERRQPAGVGSGLKRFPDRRETA